MPPFEEFAEKKHAMVLLAVRGWEVLGGYDSLKGKMFEKILHRNGGPVEFEHTCGQRKSKKLFL